MLKLQHFGHLVQRANSLEKTIMLGKIEGKRKSGWQRMRWLVSITDSMDMNLSKLWELMKDSRAWLAVVHGVGHNLATEKQQQQSSPNSFCLCCFLIPSSNFTF